METYNQPSLEATALKLSWRNYRCYHLDAPFTPPATPELQRAVTDSVQRALRVDSITPVFKAIGDTAWLCTFFHQASRDHRATTYENGLPGHVRYRPRCAATAVFDPDHRILYLSVGEKDDPGRLLEALAEELMPGPLPQPYHFDLSGVPYLGKNFLHPDIGSAPWTVLKLKCASSMLPGEELTTQEYRSATDLLETPTFFADHFCETFQMMTFAVYIPFRRRPHTLQLFHRTPCIRATVTADTLVSLAALTSLLSIETPPEETVPCDLSPNLF